MHKTITMFFFRRLVEFYKFGGIYGGRIFFQRICAGGKKNSADPDIRRRLGDTKLQLDNCAAI